MINVSGKELRLAAIRGGGVGFAVSVLCVGLMLAVVDDREKATRIAAMNLIVLPLTCAVAGIAGGLRSEEAESSPPSPVFSPLVGVADDSEAEADRLKVKNLSEPFDDNNDG
jgi:hypothetical protein